MTSQRRPSAIHAIGTVAVPVADPQRALDFYAGVLGFETRRDVTFGPGARWIEVAPRGAATTIALTPPGGRTAGVDTGIRLLSDDCAKDHASLQAQGVDVGEIARWPGVPPMFHLHDPDGNTLYVVEASGSSPEARTEP